MTNKKVADELRKLIAKIEEEENPLLLATTQIGLVAAYKRINEMFGDDGRFELAMTITKQNGTKDPTVEWELKGSNYSKVADAPTLETLLAQLELLKSQTRNTSPLDAAGNSLSTPAQAIAI